LPFDRHSDSHSGTASIFAGGGNYPIADGVGPNASFWDLMSIAIDQQSGTLFVGDMQMIRTITPRGEVSTLAGSEGGFADGTGTSAKFSYIWGICFEENSQSLLVCDNKNDKLRRVRMNGEVTTICDIPFPAAVAVTTNQSILVTNCNTLYKVVRLGTHQYEAVAIAGTGENGSVDGKADECSFNGPYGIAVHEASNTCFISEHQGNLIRKVSFVTPSSNVYL